jgi:hypothetical protein
VDNETPFAFGDFTWLNGTPRNEPVLDTKFFTAEIRFDTHYMMDFNQPIDHSISGSTEAFRAGEVQIEQASVGGDFHWNNVRGRILSMNGLFASGIPRNDASSCCPGIGQWTLNEAYRYVSEAWGGYHFNVNHGLNWMPESSPPISVCSASITSTTGPISRRMCRPTLRGFSTACACSGSPPTS